MLLTLHAQSLVSRLAPAKKSRTSSKDGGNQAALQLPDLPRFVREELGLFGLNLTTALLAGVDIRKLDAIREAADRSSCPCLVLVESEPQAIATVDEARGLAAVERMIRVVQAAHRLGCNSVAMRIEIDSQPDAFDYAAERVRMILAKAEKLEVNVLISPWPLQPSAQFGEESPAALTSEPERLTDLIKRIGGFRIGTLPDFETASKAPDPMLYLRRVVPYAQAVTAAAINFKSKKPGRRDGLEEFVHDPFDLAAYAKTVQAIGYNGTLAIDFRGSGDAVEGILAARRTLEIALGIGVEPAAAIDDELMLPGEEREDEAEGEEE